jgi:hypothetical protein
MVGLEPCTPSFLVAPTISKSWPRTPKALRPSKSRQSPRVTNPHTFTWPEHSANQWYAPWNPWSLRKSSSNKRKRIPNEQEHNLLLSLAAVDLQSGKGSSRDVGGLIYRPRKGGKPLEKSLNSSTVGWTDGSPCARVGSSGHPQVLEIAVEPSNPVSAPTLSSDAPLVYPVLKSTQSVWYYVV